MIDKLPLSWPVLCGIRDMITQMSDFVLFYLCPSPPKKLKDHDQIGDYLQGEIILGLQFCSSLNANATCLKSFDDAELIPGQALNRKCKQCIKKKNCKVSAF